MRTLSNDLYPILYNGKVYTRKNANNIFKAFYYVKEALMYDCSVYMGDNEFIYPDGTTKDVSSNFMAR